MSIQAVFDTDEARFEQDVLERSRETPVVVDFWAAWCGPCRTLSPILERLAVEADGAWVLAKVDVDSSPNLAAAFGIQGIPAVHAFKDGARVAEFVGAQPEPQVRRWLEQLGPGPADVAYQEGAAKEAAGRLDEAADSYRAALASDPSHGEARRALARVELALRAASQDGRALPEADPSDVDASIGRADAAAATGNFEAAFDTLLATIRIVAGEDRERARKHLLSLLDALNADDPRAMKARRELAAALF